jgi:transcriptional regulator with XRE-family HTH domain
MADSAESQVTEAPNGLGPQVSDARIRRGLTQKQLADRLGVSLWAVDQLEKGSRPLSLSLSRIAAATDQPLAWFAAPETSRPSAVASTAGAEAMLSAPERSARNAVLSTVAVIVLIRFFTEVIDVIPAAGNFIDIPLLILLSVMVAVRRPDAMTAAARMHYLAAGLLFLSVATVSLVLNSERVEPGPALVFLYGFLAPLSFFACAHRLWPAGQAQALVRLIVALGLAQLLVVATIDLPRFVGDGNPDHISGTFGQNPYQLVFFLLVFVSVVAGVATFQPGSRTARFAPILIAVTFVVIFLAQYRALLITTAISVVAIGLMLAPARGRGTLVGALAIGAFVLGLSYVAERYPTTKFAPTLAAIREKPSVFVRARLEPFHTVLDLYTERPRAILAGTGPGTYSSRAWRMFAEAGDAASAEGPAQPYVGLITNGVAYRTDVSDQYVRPVLERREALLGSTVALAPFSSYTSLLAEVGILGCLILLAVYLAGLARALRLTLASSSRAVRSDPLPALAIACTIAFAVLLQMAFLENWLEVVRVTIPAWVLLAVVLKEYGARSRTP